MTRYLIALALVLSAAPALGDITGQARVIDGDTLEIDGHPVAVEETGESKALDR